MWLPCYMLHDVKSIRAVREWWACHFLTSCCAVSADMGRAAGEQAEGAGYPGEAGQGQLRGAAGAVQGPPPGAGRPAHPASAAHRRSRQGMRVQGQAFKQHSVAANGLRALHSAHAEPAADRAVHPASPVDKQRRQGMSPSERTELFMHLMLGQKSS